VSRHKIHGVTKTAKLEMPSLTLSLRLMTYFLSKLRKDLISWDLNIHLPMLMLLRSYTG
jgi:hypothetical protein